MQESFTTGMPDLTNVQNNSTMQQSSYVPSSSICLANTQVPIMQNIVTDPSIVATQRATNSGVHQQQVLQQLRNAQKAQSNVQTRNAQQQQYHIQQQVAVSFAPL